MAGCLWLFRNMIQKVLDSFPEVSHGSTKPMKMIIELGNTVKKMLILHEVIERHLSMNEFE